MTRNIEDLYLNLGFLDRTNRRIIAIILLMLAVLPGLALSYPAQNITVAANTTEKFMTTSLGYPITDDNNTLTVGARGPELLEDFQFQEKLAHFDRERIPERVVHAKGAGAFGYFQVFRPMANYTKANFLQDPNARTPVFVRFSQVVGSRGSPDTVRDVRGFAVKFYTEDGNYDIVGNDIPVFFIRDGIKFPDLIHAIKPEPHNNTPSASSAHSNFWDFISHTPESTHMITWLLSDRGTPASYRMIEGFGVNTYKWVNAQGNAVYIKYHWKPLLGVKSLDRLNATRIAGEDPDYLVRDLWTAIDTGNYPQWDLYVQIMNISDENNLSFDPLDDTKTWPEDQYPLMPVGRMTLTKNPDNFFTEVEEAAFCPANVVPGVDFSDDKILQSRVFSYTDTERYRLGSNFNELPTNRPLAIASNNERDGFMQQVVFNGSVNYEPNSLPGAKSAPVEGKPYQQYVQGNKTKQQIPKTDDFTQAGERCRSLNQTDQQHLMDNIIFELGKVRMDIRIREIGLLSKADPNLGAGVARGLHLENITNATGGTTGMAGMTTQNMTIQPRRMPDQSMPSQNNPTQTTPPQNMPTQAMPSENIPSQPVPYQNVPVQEMPDQSVPVQYVPDQSKRV